MEVKDIIYNLDKFDNGLLDDIVEQIENIKKQRQENECYDAAIKLNKLLEQIVDILKELKDKDMIGDVDFLIGNCFVVNECDGEKYIDLDY